MRGYANSSSTKGHCHEQTTIAQFHLRTEGRGPRVRQTRRLTTRATYDKIAAMPMPRAPRPACPTCGTIIDIPPSQAKRRKSLYCSEACRQQGLSQPCAVCGNPFYAPKCRAGRRTCSKDCGSILSGRTRKRDDLPLATCTQCGNVFHRPPSKLSRSQNVFCSGQCRADYRSIHENGPNSPRWLNGIGRSRHTTWAKRVKQAADYQCQVCGDSPKGIRLHAHHIEGYEPHYEGAITTDDGICLCATCHVRLHAKQRKLAKAERTTT